MNQDDIQKTRDLLKKLEPGFLPYPIFEQLARIAALPVVEFIPLRLGQHVQVEVLLLDRGPDDPFWPNMLHTPGTIVRATDLHKGEPHDWQAFERIVQDELKNTKVRGPHYVGSMFHDSKRGVEQAQIYWIEVIGEPNVGTFYDAAALPDKLIQSQKAFIAQAVDNFLSHKSEPK
jgi:hypothetical protein